MPQARLPVICARCHADVAMGVIASAMARLTKFRLAKE
jgi:hypothetical protein